MEKEETNQDKPLNSNVVILPTRISRGIRNVEKASPEQDPKKFALDKIQEMGNSSSAVFALVVDETTGNPSVLMGGRCDPLWLNMFLDVLKDELKQVFLADIEFGPVTDGNNTNGT